MPEFDDDSQMKKSGSKRGATAWLGAGAFAAASIALAALAVDTLYSRAASQDQRADRPPMSVETDVIRIEPSYKTEQSFVGRIEPAREVAASFERSGLVTAFVVDEGDFARQGDDLATLDIEPLEIDLQRLAADRAALEADLELAKATMARREALQGRGFESSQSFDEAKFSSEAITARIAALEAQRRSIALDVEKSTMTAPFDGVVSERLVDEGAVVSAGAAVLVLQETTRPQARIGVPVDVAQALAVGDALDLRLSDEAAVGTIASIAPTLDPATRTVSVLADLPSDVDATMGDVVRLRVEREIVESGAWVPLGALREAARGLWALQTVVDGDAGLELSTAIVEVIYLRDGDAFVRGAIRDGARFVARAPHRGAVGQSVSLDAPGGAAQ